MFSRKKDKIDFNKHDIEIFINEKAKSTSTRRLLRPSHPLM